MSASSFANRWNTGAIEAAYEQWRQDPGSVDEKWRVFFEGFELGLGRSAAPQGEFSIEAGVFRLIQAYRELGHFIARLDPLSEERSSHPLLELSEFGLSDSDLDRVFDTSPVAGLPRATLRELIAVLRETYCRTIGVEYMHIQDTRIRRWLQERMEPRRNQPHLTQRHKLRLLMDLYSAELFECFLHTRFVGQKRFSLEGAETLIPLTEAVVERAADSGVREIVMGMAHRGRLNVLANILGKPYQEVFTEFEENWLPGSFSGDGDVKYHLGFSADRVTAQGQSIHISLTPNPSHLEAVDPVVEGRTRAKQARFGDQERTTGLPLLIHGDAAFAGQGLVAETLNLSQLGGYRTGGTIHLIVNNQIGFTTAPTDARSTFYCTDVAKMIQVPIFHFNGEDPEAARYLARLAMDFRQTFHRDVVLDMYCYRRHGHNEADEPSFTQPLMYAKIEGRPSLSEIYTEQLIMRGDLTVDEVTSLKAEFEGRLHRALEEVKTTPPRYEGMRGYAGTWKGLKPHVDPEPVDTSVPFDRLRRIMWALTHVPESFAVHPKIERQLRGRWKDFEDGKAIDWATGEAWAFGSLLLEGKHVRLSGQDSRRGTFSHRHAVLYDGRTAEPYVPLNHLAEDQAVFSVYDSLLSEAAVLGFEFGYALDSPDALVLWEAQFGDFANGAQVIIDQFISCSTSKWQRDSGLVMLLPHGYEGQGPEHSSARLERYLQLCAEDNMQVCNFTTPAQYFHALRRQLKRDYRKPLIVMTPKSLLRHRMVVSPVEEFTHGTFQEVLDDPRLVGSRQRAGANGKSDPDRVCRVVLCSGKVYYDFIEALDKKENSEVALVRIEQFYPFPRAVLQRILDRYRHAREWVWVQEESQNMGGWFFMEPRLREMGYELLYVGRDVSASPATGSRQIHLREQKELFEATLFGKAPYLVRSTPPAALASRKLEVPQPVG
jgi:2-oxoglutarate dehydrogenase E1 component